MFLRPLAAALFESTFTNTHTKQKNRQRRFLCFAYGGGFAFLRKSHGGCDSPPDCRQEPPFESTFTNTHTKQKNRQRRFLCLVGEGGFEPPKSVTTDLQSAPFGHSGIPPYSVVPALGAKVGAGRRTRTPDLLITNQLLYQLSYTSVSSEHSYYSEAFPNCQALFLPECGQSPMAGKGIGA